MTNRAGVTALVTLAMLNVFTLGAGVAVAGMLPARLALWQVPRVARAGVEAPGRVLVPASARGQEPSRGRLTALLAPLLATHALGQHVGAVVTDLDTGRVLFSRNAGSGFVPASNAKMLTAVAALSTLGPSARFTTRVVAGARPGQLTLVGGGDPTLAAGPPPRSDYPQPATLASLAAATAHWLAARHTRAVRLTYDTSLFTGPSTAPGWTPSYISTGNVTPITSLEVDQGRLTRSGAPQDADDPANFRARSDAPATEAAGAFARLLRGHGIRVVGPPATGRQPRHATEVAAVRSPPLASIVGWMLRESNNVIAEDLARQIALHAGKPASFSGGAAAVTAILGRLGVRHGIHLVDGSGLSPMDQVTPRALAAVVRLAAVSGPGALRAAVTGMPVAGFSGTLAPGQSVFGSFGSQALGMVRAKTGNLSKVASLSGIAAAASGRVLAFAFMADQIPKGSQLPAAAAAIDAMATALAGCGCR
ncbi:MAG TPA: D-alanyl-D-alanine carboxypeptidase/D-alanyl-D-alanine-endopeptidase [Streptosporangiaceae bacterium]|nr:D-alanyl-D-alanine carboxypeptidase/D-alanyl-D-alanine-endopeptidase [Streptosporangiaceae bacterium]